MATVAGQNVKLASKASKKSAVFATGSITPAATEVGLRIGTSVPLNKTQSVVGTFKRLANYYLTNIHKIKSTNSYVHMPLGGPISSAAVGGTVGNGEVVIYFGADIRDKEQTHYFDKTFKCLIELWLEKAKKGP